MKRVVGISEIVLWTGDKERALRFYHDLIGLEVISPPTLPNVFLRVGEGNAGIPQMIVLEPKTEAVKAQPSGYQLHHMALELPEQAFDIPADVAFLFASEAYAEHFSEMMRRVRKETGTAALVGCSGPGIIGSAQELEGVPALSLLTLALPGAKLHAVHFTQEMIENCGSPHAWHEQLGVTSDEVNGWLIFADPFQMDVEGLIDGLAEAYSGRPMLGGLASGDTVERRTFVFLDDDVFDEGGVGLAIGGAYTILPLVSQGCEPIGEPWTITKVRGNLIETISNRPAYDLLIETLHVLPTETQRRARYNLP